MTNAKTLQFEAVLRIEPETGSWTVFDVPGSAEFFGTRRATRVVGDIDGVPVRLTLLPTKRGHIGPVKAATRHALGKQAGDAVRVRIAAVGA
ncbi:DUF1905 domain-containing protein [Agromyces silvae]|uniref:DUF1905 domain-containing protein n=1 Tax=Agromyces silvae TaxID=3388266 RepID=UPI00280B7646|nr:DUF1905 domain-containing protein [Agromyces protaetiae]